MEPVKDGYEFPGSLDYWEKRYAQGGHSGAGSLNWLGEFKAEIVNGFIEENGIATVVEWGCGDGNQLALMNYPSYLGLDVSESAVKLCADKFSDDGTKSFQVINDRLRLSRRYDLSLSLDVIYHLVEDPVFETYMSNLFSSSKRFVIVYASNTDSNQGGYYNHMRHRKFTDHVKKTLWNWELIRHIPNRYPYNLDDFNNTSFCDFYIFRCLNPVSAFLKKVMGSAK